MDWTPLPGTT